VVYNTILIMKQDVPDQEKSKRRLSYIKGVGLFAMVFGILGQLIGLYDAFSVIQKVGDISPSILAGGLKVSMLSTLYGIIIYLLSWLFWFGLEAFRNLRGQ